MMMRLLTVCRKEIYEYVEGVMVLLHVSYTSVLRTREKKKGRKAVSGKR